jgi:pantetheine-phosphate adenylyltransferase
LLEEVVRPCPNVRVQAFEGLAVKFVRSVGARVMLRGLRTLSDMEYEFSMSLMNLNLDPGIETIFLMAKEDYSHVSSSLLRDVATFGGDLSKFLPNSVRGALERRAREKAERATA